MMGKHKKIRSAIFFFAAAAALFLGLAVKSATVYQTIGVCLLALALFLAVLGAIGLYALKKPKLAKRLQTLLLMLAALGVCLFIALEIPIISSARTDKAPEAPYLIVLGAGVDGKTPSLSLYNRLTAAKAYLEAYPQAKAVLSGGQGQGEEITEAECMRLWLTQNGISPDRLLLEEKSNSTETNLINSLTIISAQGGDPTGKIAVLSSEYHLYRAKFMARQLGAQPLGVAGHTSNFVLMVNYFIREAFAIVYLWIM